MDRFSRFFIVSIFLLSLFGCKPSLNDITFEGFSGEPLHMNLSAMIQAKDKPTDAPINFYLMSEPKYGKLKGELPNVIYTSNPGYIGVDSFTVKAGYKDNTSLPAKVTVNISPKNKLDSDGDLVLDSVDAFPLNPSEIYDTDKNGVGNFAQKDEDEDGVNDLQDAFPLDKSKKNLINTEESEFNDNINQATNIQSNLPFSISGAVSRPADSDVFKFTLEKTGVVSILLEKEAKSFIPTLSVIDASGTPLLALTHKLTTNEFSGYSVQIDKKGVYYIVVADFNGAHNQNYTYKANVFIDDDYDLVSQDLEIANGLNYSMNDSDQDGILDFYEFTLAHKKKLGLDVDGDGLPNWLDKDADGNGVKDSLEKAADTDGDGIPDFLDMDNDGNGISDSGEIGDNVLNPKDTDADGIPDYSDIDDDNDALVDSIDPDRLTPLKVSSYTDKNRLIINSVYYVNEGKQVRKTLIQGKKIVVDGEGFAPDITRNNIVLKTENGFVLVKPVQASENQILFDMPANVSANQVFVVRDLEIRSSEFKVNTLKSGLPVLFTPDFLSAKVGSTVIFEGENLSSGVVVNAGGVQITPVLKQGGRIEFDVPTGAKSGDWFLISSQGESNRIKINVTQASNTQIVVPKGYPVAFGDMYISNSTFDEFPVNANGTSNVGVNTKKIDLLDVYMKWNGREIIGLSGFSIPSEKAIEISPLSTAIALSLGGNSSLDYLNVQQSESLKKQMMASPEIKALADLIANNIVKSPDYLMLPNQDLLDAKYTARGAADRIIKSLFKPNTRLNSFRSTSISAPNITDEQFDIKVNAIKDGDYTGDIEVENDTMLFLNTQITEKQTGQILFPYETHVLSDDFVSPQVETIFNARKKSDYNQCDFKDCVVSISVKDTAMKRTFLEKIVVPAVNDFLAMKFLKDREMAEVILSVYPTAVNAAYYDFLNNDLTSGLNKIAQALLDDVVQLENSRLWKALNAKLGGGIAKKILKKILVRVIPFVGQAKLVISAISKIAGKLNKAKLMADFVFFWARQDEFKFEVSWGLQGLSFSPASHDQSEGGLIVRLKGVALNKASQVMVADKSGKTKDLVLTDVNENYTEATVNIPSDWLSFASDYLEFTLIENETGRYIPVDGKLLLTADVVISNLSSQFAYVGEELCVFGSGFSPQREKNKIFINSKSGGEPVLPFSASKEKLCLILPYWAESGSIYVEVTKQDTNGNTYTKASNKIALYIKKSDLSITFGDNGSLNDDTFALIVNGKLIYSMPSPSRRVGPFIINDLREGLHSVILRGITAPDDVGTYYINISGKDVKSINGPSRSGSDLTAGVQKIWGVEIKPDVSTRSVGVVNDMPSASKNNEHVPIIWSE